MSRVRLLLAQTDEVYDRLRQRLAGLTDDEYLWEPVPGCWTIHRDESGAWVSDYAEPDPDPADQLGRAVAGRRLTSQPWVTS
jgi:hypothetical protein